MKNKSTKYIKQVSHDHYGNEYDNFERYVSYYNQTRIINYCLNPDKKTSMLEVGVGSGFLKNFYSRGSRTSYKSFDIAKDLNPDYVGNILDLSKLIGRKEFDITVCFEVLEHIEFKDVEKALVELKKVTKNYVIISVPQVRLHFSIAIKIPRRGIKKLMFAAPFPLNHTFDGQHYWELGKRNYPPLRFRKLLTAVGFSYKEYTDPLNPYHRFFICKV